MRGDSHVLLGLTAAALHSQGGVQELDCWGNAHGAEHEQEAGERLMQLIPFQGHVQMAEAHTRQQTDQHTDQQGRRSAMGQASSHVTTRITLITRMPAPCCTASCTAAP